jgi:amino acid transporter
MCDLCTSKFDVSSRSAFTIATAQQIVLELLHNIFWCYRNVDYCRNDYDFNFACNNGLIMTGARVYYTMAQDGVFFKKRLS